MSVAMAEGVKPIREGTKKFEGGETWVHWWWLPRMSDEEVREFLEDENIGYHYGGPGRVFMREPDVRHNWCHTLITQSCGLDI